MCRTDQRSSHLQGWFQNSQSRNSNKCQTVPTDESKTIRLACQSNRLALLWLTPDEYACQETEAVTRRDPFVSRPGKRVGRVVRFERDTHKSWTPTFISHREANSRSIPNPIILLHYLDVITELILHVLFSFRRITLDRLLPPDAKC